MARNRHFACNFTPRVPLTRSAFEAELDRLGIPEKSAAGDARMAIWVRANYRHRFVPEDILEALGLRLAEIDVVVCPGVLTRFVIGSVMQ
jgi:hypothetical protein